MRNKVVVVDLRHAEVEEILKYNPFLPISWISIISGVEIVPDYGDRRSKWLLVRQIFFLSLYWIYLPFSSAVQDQSETTAVTQLSIWIYMFFSAGFQLSFILRGEKRRVFIEHLAADTTKSFKRRLLLTSTLFLGFIIVTIGLQLARFFDHWKVSVKDSQPHEIVLAIVYGIIEYIEYEPKLLSMSIYILSFLLYYHSVRVRSLSLVTLAHSANDDAMFDVLDSIRVNHSEFEELFNFNPLIWLVHGFLQAVILFLYWNVSTYLGTVYLTIKSFAVLGVFFYLASVTTRIASWVDEIKSVYGKSTSPRKQMSFSLSAALDASLKTKFTIWQMFDIDRSLIASYFGTVLTFTVLLVQVRNGALMLEKS